MGSKVFITAEEMATILGISRPYAYKLIKQMNDELESNKYMTVPGKVSRKFFEEKFYGVSTERRNI